MAYVSSFIIQDQYLHTICQGKKDGFLFFQKLERNDIKSVSFVVSFHVFTGRIYRCRTHQGHKREINAAAMPPECGETKYLKHTDSAVICVFIVNIIRISVEMRKIDDAFVAVKLLFYDKNCDSD